MSALYGVLAGFQDSPSLISAAHSARSAGYRRIELYCPFPCEGLGEAAGMTRDNVALAALLGGLMGGVFGYFMQWYANLVDYPIIAAGRPYHSWPSFIVPTFELTILGAAVTGAFAMLAMNRLPQLFHPVFLVDRFRERASTDAFFLCIRSDDPTYEHSKVREFLESLQCVSLDDVPMRAPEDST